MWDTDRVGGSAWPYDVALSFAGAERAYVHQVADRLKAVGLRVFYDADEQAMLWGKHLTEALPKIYGDEAAVVVVFASAAYADRSWTNLERRAALDRAARERREYVLLARFDDTRLPGILSSMVYVDLRLYAPRDFADLVHAKWKSLGLTAGGTSPARPASAGHSADILLSSVTADEQWAGWIVTQLRQSSFVVIEQVWDTLSVVKRSTVAAAQADGAVVTLAVTSAAYVAGVTGDNAWRETYETGRDAQTRRLAVVRTEDGALPGRLGQVPACDLAGVDEATAVSRLVDHANRVRFGTPGPAARAFPGARRRAP